MQHLRLLMAALLFGTALAGCAGSNSSDGAGNSDPLSQERLDEQVGQDIDVQATATTGVIRGVVVDPSITPVAGALISVKAGARTLQTNSTAGGSFGFQGLDPGTYFVKVSKIGFVDVQQSVDVAAGVSDPPSLKVRLEPDASFVKPYYQAHVFTGFIECAVTAPVVAFAACSVGNECLPGTGCINATNDSFNVFISVDAPPAFIQHELIWDSTQGTGNMFNLATRTATQDQFTGGGYEDNLPGDFIGTSPLLATANGTVIEKYKIGLDGMSLAPAVFAGGMEGTQVCDPLPFCTFATGATIQQSFTLYTHLFYGFEPAPEYRFSSDGNPVPPS